MITELLLDKTTDFVISEIDNAKIIIDNITSTATIDSIAKSGSQFDVLIDVTITEGQTINGIELYDSSNELLIKDNKNISITGISTATYRYRLDLFAENTLP